MRFTPRLVLLLAFALVGCEGLGSSICKVGTGAEDDAAERACDASEEAARQGWENAHDPTWPVQPQPTLDGLEHELLGATSAAVRGRLGPPHRTRPAEAERPEEWVYYDRGTRWVVAVAADTVAAVRNETVAP